MRKWVSVKGYKQITEIKKNALTFSSDFMFFAALKNIYPMPRCLIITTKKRISKKSTVRNRVKRRIRAALDCINLQNLDIIVIPNILCLNVNFNNLVQEIENLQLAAIKKLKI